MKINNIYALVSLIAMQAIAGYAFAETTETGIGTLPAVQMNSWKKVPGGVSFIKNLHEEQQKKITKKITPQTIMQQAVDNDNPSILEALIKRGNDITVKDATGQTLVHLTIDNENTDQLKILLTAGLDPNARDNAGITPLHLFLNAILEKPKEKAFAQDAIKVLLGAGADMHATGTFGVSPWEMVNWRKNGSALFDADTIVLFLTTISPQEAQYAQKGAQEKAELINNKLAAAKKYLPFYSKTEPLKVEIEKNMNDAIKKLSTVQST